MRSAKLFINVFSLCLAAWPSLNAEANDHAHRVFPLSPRNMNRLPQARQRNAASVGFPNSKALMKAGALAAPKLTAKLEAGGEDAMFYARGVMGSLEDALLPHAPGSSGSPVFDAQTHELKALVWGAPQQHQRGTNE